MIHQPSNRLLSNIVGETVSPSWVGSPAFVPLVLLGLTLAMFAGPVFVPHGQILSYGATDLRSAFVYWREFGFESMRRGHVPLWNPYVLSGIPFAGNFQPALFYPPNWIYLVLPLPNAINFEIALHVFLLGLFMAAWMRAYRLHPLAQLFAASTVMFGGAFFPHIYAGHLATLDTMAWTPLILLVVDKLIDDPGPEWVMVGILGVAMQLLGGSPQTLFNTMVACLLYGSIRFRSAPRPARTLISVGIVGVGAAALSTVQLWTGIEAASETTRQGGLPFHFAAMYSFPPENLLTLLVPGFFGNETGFPYWGRWNFWEMCAYFGVTGLSMAALGLSNKSSKRLTWAVMAAILLLLALASHTPLFAILYRYLPAFNRFRSHSKFIFQAGLFAVVLAAHGTDDFLRSARASKPSALIALIGAVLISAIGVWLYFGTLGVWGEWMSDLASSPEALLPHQYYGEPQFLERAREFAGSRCLISAAILALLGAIFFIRASRAEAAYAMVFLGIAEMFAFAHSTLVSFPFASTVPLAERDFLAAHPGDYRVFQTVFPANSSIAIGVHDILGYDPMAMARYVEFLAYSQGDDPWAGMRVHIRRYSPLLRLLRLRFVLQQQGNRLEAIEAPDPLPHLALVNGWVELSDRDRILSTLGASGFDPLKTVVVERAPDPRPTNGEPRGTATITDYDSDSLVIAAETDTPTLLLITDCYSRYWRATALPGSHQDRYTVMRADYTLMAIPLSAGKHLLRLHYAPDGYVIGRWISLGAIGAYLACVAILWRVRRRTREDRT